MSLITLPKSFLSGHPLRISPKVVSNGHWLVRKTALRDSTPFASIETTRVYAPRAEYVTELRDDAVDQLVPGEALVFQRSAIAHIEDDGRVMVLFTGTDGERAWVNLEYADRLDLTTLYGFSRGYDRKAGYHVGGLKDGTGDDWKVIIMTCRGDLFNLALDAVKATS